MHSSSNASSKRKLMLGISALALTAASSAASAQEAADVTDEVVVTGIRASLERSLDIKRNAKGVVDAISAEDMGKFPDSNLAESLQRVTGVSIDRDNGEGSTVTVRGFGADYNLVTFNGRTMPTSTLGGGNDAPSTRSFDFANLAPEAVAGVEIYKTGRASVPSGGIGSLINIRTNKPLEAPGFQATFAHKYVDDESHNGAEATAEYSALVMNTFMDDRLGIALTAVSQDRKHSVNHFHADWNDFRFGDADSGNIFDDNDNTVNAPSADQVYSFPVTTRYVVKDFTQERSNFQLTGQYDVNESIRATVDYTYAERDFTMDGNHISFWWDHAKINSAWGDESPVPSILYYEEDFGDDPSDIATGVYATNNVNETDSLGFNLEWDVNDRLSLAFDFHSSTAESRPDSPFGSENVIEGAAMVVATQKVDFTKEIPVLSFTAPDDIADPYSVTHKNPTGSVLHNALFKNEISQSRVDGSYELNNEYFDSIDFGFSTTESKIRSAYGNIQADNWSGILQDTSQVPAETWGPTLDLPPLFAGLEGSSQILAKYQQINFLTLKNYIQSIDDADKKADSKKLICGDEPDCIADYTVDRFITEDTSSWYVQGSKDFEIAEMPASIVAGLRFEETDVTSTALVPQPSYLEWTGPNELTVRYSAEDDYSTITGSYDFILPSIDFDIDLEDNLKLRASYSETITRPSYASMQGGQTLSDIWNPTTYNTEEFNGTASSGNAALDPYLSENIDVSLEYYYGDSSYASVGHFEKDVSNWIGNSSTIVTTGEGQGVLAIPLLNPSEGAGQEACEAASTTQLNNKTLRNCLKAERGLPLKSADGDLPAVVQYTQPVASDRVQTLDGIEIAWQHELSAIPFTDIALDGFGFIANYTIVNGDAKFDNSKESSAGSQFALLGLSDSANFIAYYEKNGLSTRLAWNWRDRFLTYADKTSAYVEDYQQYDLNISYEIPNTSITLTYDGINLTEENRKVFQRNNPTYATFASPGRTRHYLGARYHF